MKFYDDKLASVLFNNLNEMSLADMRKLAQKLGIGDLKSKKRIELTYCIIAVLLYGTNPEDLPFDADGVKQLRIGESEKSYVPSSHFRNLKGMSIDVIRTSKALNSLREASSKRFGIADRRIRFMRFLQNLEYLYPDSEGSVLSKEYVSIDNQSEISDLTNEYNRELRIPKTERLIGGESIYTLSDRKGFVWKQGISIPKEILEEKLGNDTEINLDSSQDMRPEHKKKVAKEKTLSTHKTTAPVISPLAKTGLYAPDTTDAERAALARKRKEKIIEESEKAQAAMPVAEEVKDKKLWDDIEFDKTAVDLTASDKVEDIKSSQAEESERSAEESTSVPESDGDSLKLPMDLNLMDVLAEGEADSEKSEGKSDEDDDKDLNIEKVKKDTEKSAIDPARGFATGVVEVNDFGYGFLRTQNFLSGISDVYVPSVQIKRFGLQTGDIISCDTRLFEGNKYASAIFISSINGIPCDQHPHRTSFDSLIPQYPCERIKLEGLEDKNGDITMRAIDLIAPIGKGQRALIVSPPKAGKTTILKYLAQAITQNNKEIKTFMLLVDERPEEVTDIIEAVPEAEVIYSTFDMTVEHHARVADLVLKSARRHVEYGRDVVILLDSITRLARTYNQVTEQSGRTLTGGLDASAMIVPKQFFGAARSVKGGGSLTVIATALVETGSRMDDIIYEEFKGTGNMELQLSRKLSEMRVFPAIDISKSGTRREELLMDERELNFMNNYRRGMAKYSSEAAMQGLISLLNQTYNNEDLLNRVKKLKI
ncbi:MAG: transcription termination factor Rho [Clostridia bacterium]|nr:transcription termination factor Rho [Clostridia bacterium]